MHIITLLAKRRHDRGKLPDIHTILVPAVCSAYKEFGMPWFPARTEVLTHPASFWVWASDTQFTACRAHTSPDLHLAYGRMLLWLWLFAYISRFALGPHPGYIFGMGVGEIAV